MNITDTTFEAKQYLVLRKAIATSQIADKQMYDDAGQQLGAFIQQQGLQITGPWTVIYFKWEEPAGQAEIGIAFPIASAPDAAALEGTGLEIVSISETKAFKGELHGSYDGLGDAHQEMMTYWMQNGGSIEDASQIAVEEYTVGPTEDANPENWITTIYYLHT